MSRRRDRGTRTLQKGLRRSERPAQGGQPPRRGPGRVRRRRQAARDGLPPFRPLAVRARADRLDRRPRRTRAARGLRHADGRRGRDPDRPVLPDRGRRPAAKSRTTRSRSARCATSASPSSRSSPRPASSPATPRSWSRSTTSRSDVVVDARVAPRPSAPVLHEEAGGNMSYTGVWEWGDVDAAFAEADHVVTIKELHFDRFNSTPLETRRRPRRVEPRHGAVDDHHEQPVPGVRRDHDGAGDAGRTRQAADRHAGHRRRLRQQDHVASQLVACCLLARKLNRPIQWTEWRTDFHQSMSHGNERWFLDTEVAVQGGRHDVGVPDEGGRRRGRLPPLRAARRGHLVAGGARHVRLAQHPRSSSRRR